MTSSDDETLIAKTHPSSADNVPHPKETGLDPHAHPRAAGIYIVIIVQKVSGGTDFRTKKWSDVLLSKCFPSAERKGGPEWQKINN